MYLSLQIKHSLRKIHLRPLMARKILLRLLKVIKDTSPSPPIKETKKSASVSNLESEISKIKIPVPFGEILKVNEYRSKIVKMLNSQPGAADILNIQEDQPTIYLGPRLEDEKN